MYVFFFVTKTFRDSLQSGHALPDLVAMSQPKTFQFNAISGIDFTPVVGATDTYVEGLFNAPGCGHSYGGWCRSEAPGAAAGARAGSLGFCGQVLA